jgi:hypothetical protein
MYCTQVIFSTNKINKKKGISIKNFNYINETRSRAPTESYQLYFYTEKKARYTISNSFDRCVKLNMFL